MSKWLRYLLVGVSVILFAVIRTFQADLFYDPLLEFFHGNFKGYGLPDIDLLPFSASLIFRYLLNTALSLGIIYLLFQKKSHLLFAGTLYAILGVICVVAVLIFIYLNDPENHLLLFYTRRILIQPLFLFIILPALYFQERSAKDN